MVANGSEVTLSEVIDNLAHTDPDNTVVIAVNDDVDSLRQAADALNERADSKE